MNYIIHLKKLANLNNKKCDLKEKEARNMTTAKLFFSCYSDVSSPTTPMFLLFPDLRGTRRREKMKWSSKADFEKV